MPARHTRLKSVLMAGTTGFTAAAAVASPHIFAGIDTATAFTISAMIIAGVATTNAWHYMQNRVYSQANARLNSDVAALQNHTIVSTTGPNGAFDHFNETFLNVTGYKAEALLKRPPIEIYHPEDRFLYPEIQNRLAQNDVWTGELRLIGAKGQTIWTQSTILPRFTTAGKRIGAISVRTDISDRRAVAGMRDMVSTLHNLLDPVLMVCPGTLQIVFANRAALTLLGWKADGYDHRKVSDIPFTEGREKVAPNLGKLCSSQDDRPEQVKFDVEYDGIAFRADVQLIKPDAGETRLFLVLRNQMVERELNREKDKFVSTVSHELRTPLTSIKGALGLVLSGAAGAISPKAKDLISIAHRNADRLVLIVNDILDLEKLASGRHGYDLKQHNLYQSLLEAVEANQAFAERHNVQIKIAQDTDVTALATYDSSRIHQVLTNLMSNACKFSPPGSVVTTAIRNTATTCVVSVTDEGAGIAEEAIETIFERFNQAGRANRDKSGSTGLGLSIVKAIVETHGGEVAIKSTQGVGTTVTFSLVRDGVPCLAAPVPISTKR